MPADAALEMSYPVKIDSTPVFLTVKIGEAQMGSSIAQVDQDELGVGKLDSLLVGSNDDLRSKTLEVTTVVQDVNPNTNNTSVTYNLIGGVGSLSTELKATVKNDFGEALYVARFKFV